MGVLDRLEDVLNEVGDFVTFSPEGAWERTERTIGGFGQSLQAPVGLVYDIMVAPMIGRENDRSVVGSVKSRMGQFVEGVFGPTHGLGAVIGGGPELLRQPFATAIQPGLAALDWTYDELVSQPLSTLMTMGSLADVPGGGSWGVFADADAWRKAYRIAEHRSPGQAVALAFGTKNIEDPREVERFVGTDLYETVSGVTDAVFRWYLSPDVLAGKAISAARVARWEGTAANVNRWTARGHYDDFFGKRMEGLNAGQIRDRFFPDNEFGADLADLLERAGDAKTRVQVGRIASGAIDEISPFARQRADLATELDRLLKERDTVRNLTESGFILANHPDELATQSQALIEQVPDLEKRLAKLEYLDEKVAGVRGGLTQIPHSRVTDPIRTTVTRSHWYQRSRTGGIARVTFGMRAHPYLKLDDPTSDVMVWRQLQASKLSLEEKMRWRSRYIAATSPADRAGTYASIEERIIEDAATRHGLTKETLEQILTSRRRGHDTANAILKQRRFDGNDPSRSLLEYADDAGTMHEVPLLETQQANLLAITNAYDIEHAATRVGRWASRHPTTQIPAEILETFYKIWKPSVLLRVGWPLRVVGDEQLRIIAKIGALAQAKQLGKSFTSRHLDPDVREWRKVVKQLKDSPSDALAARAGALEAQLTQKYAVQVGTHRFAPGLGVPGEYENAWRNLNSSRPDMLAFLTRDERRILNNLRGTGQWAVVTPSMPGYADAWQRAVNLQIGQSALGRKMLEEADDMVVARWLIESPEGRKVLHAIPARRDVDDVLNNWVRPLREQIESYLPHPDLKAAALKRRAQASELERLARGEPLPPVHGEILAQALGGGVAIQTVRKATDKMFQWLGSAPTDVLSRNPFFSAVYEGEVKRRVQMIVDQGGVIDAKTIGRIEVGARRHALRESRTLLYDLAEESQLSHMLKFVTPFYSAWQEVLTRWAGLAVENPAFVFRMRQLYRAPERADAVAGWIGVRSGLVTDEYGNVIDEDGIITDPAGPAWKKGEKGGSQHRITLRVPKVLGDIPIVKEIVGGAAGMEVAFDKSAVNLVLQGPPGFGPIVQVAANEIAKDRPDLEDSLRWALPWGTTQDTMSILMPAWAKRLQSRTQQEDNVVFSNTLIRDYLDQVVKHQLGQREADPSWSEARSHAQNILNLRLVASLISPVQPVFNSPYQPYIDAFRARREYDAGLTQEQRSAPDYQTPEEWFIDTYGEEFFPLTQSLTHSIDGVPATIEGWETRKKYKDLIEANPEYGALIVGSEGAGEFSRAVYDNQLSSALSKQSARHQRERFSFEEATDAPEIRLGWIKYRKAMDMIDQMRIAAGYPNLQVKDAQPLAMLRRLTIAVLENQHPAWRDDRSRFDVNAMAKRLSVFSTLVTEPGLQARPEFQGLDEYLRRRELMRLMLKARRLKGGAGTLDAAENQDLATLWGTMVSTITDKNLPFGDLYYRYLSQDSLETDPQEEVA